jgi:hypothetical protein
MIRGTYTHRPLPDGAERVADSDGHEYYIQLVSVIIAF